MADDFNAEAAKAAVMRRTKRVLLALLALLIIVPFCLLAYPCAIAPLRNDLAADRLLKTLLGELPPEITVADTAAWAGNSSGTGNHVELWAGVLLEKTNGVDEIPGVPAAELKERPQLYGYPNTAAPEELFPVLAETDDWDGYLIYGTLGRAATQWDIRGH